MATACVAFPLGDVRGVDYPPQKAIRQWGTGSDDIARRFKETEVGTWIKTMRRCASASDGSCLSKPTSRSTEFASPLHRKAFALVAELLQYIARLPRVDEDDPPSKEGDPSALPLHFDSECLAQARVEVAMSAPAKSEAKETKRRETELLQDPTMEHSFDVSEATRIRTRGKAAKKAAKKAQQSKWMDSDNEDGAKNGEGGNDGEGGGGNDGGAGGGAGGNGDGGAGGDDGDDWDFGGKKNKKNKKKAKQEEEEKRAREEEEELKKKGEEAAAANMLSWADETNDANVDDEWAAFSGKKEKKKKGKKSGEETTIAAPDPPTAAFQDINLDDGAPKLDFSFGGAESRKDTKAGGFGAWGKTWDFASIGGATGGDKAAEAGKGKDGKDKSTDFGDNNPWSFENKTKTKKKSTMTSDFDFGGFGAGQDTTDFDLGLDGGVNAKPAGEDTWGFAAVNKKDKKKKGKDAAEEKEDMLTPRPELNKEKEADDSWGIWGTSKKDKKKGAKGAAEDPVPEKKATSPIAEPASTFDWGLPSSKKDKKNKKTALVNEFENDPIVAIEDVATGDITATGNDDWMNSGWTTGSKKDKKGKKGVGGESTDPPESTTAVDTNTTASTALIGDDEWGFSTTKSKKDKKGKKSDAKASDFPPVPPPPPPPPAPEPAQEDDGWDTFGKKDKKLGKKAKAAISEPVFLDADPSIKPAEETKEDSTWGSWGLSSKDKKKKDKEAKKKDISELVAQAPAKAAEKEEIVAEDDIWSSWGMAGKKKSGKKGKDEPPPPAPTPPAQGLTPEPGPAAMPEWEDDGWAELTSTKTKNNSKKGVLSRSSTLTGTTSKPDDANSKSKDAKDEKGEVIASPKDEKASSKKDATKDETPAKTAKSMWGSFGGTSTTAKAKLAKEKEKRDEEKAKEAEEAALAEAEGAKQSSKSKTAGKLSKSEAKSGGKVDDKKKADEAALIDILDEPLRNEEKASSKLKNPKLDAKTPADKKNRESGKQEEKKPDDYFGFWATSKKTTGKKDAETKKEINKQGLSNENDALAGFPNDLEGPVADEPTPTPKLSKTMSTSITKNKNTVSSSVSARIKALEANKKEEKADKSKVEPQIAKDLSIPDQTAATSPKEEKKKDPLGKSKTASTSSPKSIRKKDLSPPAQEKKAKETVPGSFPGAFGDDDDLMALDDFPAAPEKKSVKKAKDDKKVTAKSKTVKMEDILVEAPEPPKLPTPPPEEKKPVKKERARVERTGAASSWGFWGAASTPKKESTKKEATRSVEEEEGAPLPKPKGAGPGLSRSKSTKTPKEKEREDQRNAEKASKSSGSDTKDKRSEARVSKPSRGMSFSSFMMGGPPPSATRTKPTRQSSVGGSRPASRRQSVNVDAGGLMSPPPDEHTQMSDKAAKVMGVRGGKLDRTKSVKGKERASSALSSSKMEEIIANPSPEVVPDPYPIDDDDMVMVNGLEDPLLNGASSKNAAKGNVFSKTKSKREVGKTSSSIFPTLFRPSWEPEFIKEVQADGKVFYQQSKSSKPRARTLSNEEDVVMVEAGPSGGEPFITSGPDDMAFVEHTAPEVKRSNTATKKPGGFFGGLFGGAGKAEKVPDAGTRPRPTSSYRDDRKMDAEAQPTRAKDKSKRRSMKPHHLDVEDPDQIETSPVAEARAGGRRTAREAEEAGRAELRKSRREKERAELEARRSKARDRARKEQEAEEQRREAKRARRAAREEARLKEEADVEAAAAARRDERRRLRAELEASELEKAKITAEGQEGLDKMRNMAKEDRKKQFEREEEERLRRREEKKSKAKEKPSGGKRKSTTSPLMNDYFESRNGSAGGTPKQPGGPTDKTSSWVKSQASDPPDLPPVEGTILDGEKPRSAGFFADEEHGEERKRSSKKESSSRRHVKYVDPEPDERDRDRRPSRRKDSRRTAAAAQDKEDGGINSASGSGGERDADRTPKHRSRRREVNEEYDAYADGGPAATTAMGGIRTFDGRPANNKRNSILGRLGGFL